MIKSMIIVVTFVTATIYHAVPEQTDSSPFVTASLARINPSDPGGHRWIAVSRDLEELGFTFDVKVCVEGAGNLNGDWCVNDRMNERWVRRIDFLVDESMRGGKWENVKLSIITE